MLLVCECSIYVILIKVIETSNLIVPYTDGKTVFAIPRVKTLRIYLQQLWTSLDWRLPSYLWPIFLVKYNMTEKLHVIFKKVKFFWTENHTLMRTVELSDWSPHWALFSLPFILQCISQRFFNHFTVHVHIACTLPHYVHTNVQHHTMNTSSIPLLTLSFVTFWITLSLDFPLLSVDSLLTLWHGAVTDKGHPWETGDPYQQQEVLEIEAKSVKTSYITVFLSALDWQLQTGVFWLVLFLVIL